MDDKAFIEEVKAAFQDTKYPGDDNLVIDFDKYDQTHEMWQAFKGKHWREVTADQAEDWRLDIGNFTSQGFYFFLPAFLIAACDDDPLDLDSYLIFSFVPNRRNHFDEYVSMLTAAQKAVIKKYVQDFYERNPHYLDAEDERAKIFWGIE